MPILAAPPPPTSAAIAIAIQELRPLGFAGFRAHMPMSEAKALVISAGGSLTCKATTDPRLRECTGIMPFPKVVPPFRLLISSVRDTAAVIVLTANIKESDTSEWARALTQDYGTPNHKTNYRVSETWQWIRTGQMLRLIEHQAGGVLETAVTLTDGPLLDALGPPATYQKPPGPKKQKPD
jgi:hypothetical protein